MFNSLMIFNPDNIRINTVPPEVLIESIVYSNPRSKKPEEHSIRSLEISYNQNRITFNFIALHYVNPAQNQYAYKLAGYDKDWVQGGTERNVTYNNLDPGTYTFHVKAANSDGLWSKEDETMTILIHPPWWRTWWAYIIYALLIATALRGYVIYRSR